MTLFMRSVSSILEKYRLRLTKISSQGLLRLISSNDVISYGVAFYSHRNITGFHNSLKAATDFLPIDI